MQAPEGWYGPRGNDPVYNLAEWLFRQREAGLAYDLRLDETGTEKLERYKAEARQILNVG